MKRTCKLLIASVLFCSCLAGCNNTATSKKSTITFEQWKTIADSRSYAPMSYATADAKITQAINNKTQEIEGKQYFSYIDGSWNLIKDETNQDDVGVILNITSVIETTAKKYAEQLDNIINNTSDEKYTFKFYKDLSLKVEYNIDSITPGAEKGEGKIKFNSNGFISYLDARLSFETYQGHVLEKYRVNIKYSD